MKYSCEIIRDLLPLYIDDVASPYSRQMVEEHLAACADCRDYLSRLKNDEAETAITAEKQDVIAGQRRSFRRRSAVAGSAIAGIFMIPILVCLIVNLATGAGLDWFFIVLASLLVAASLTIVPLMAPENKGLWTLGSFAVSLILLFGVCCLYTGGGWFFVASTAALFGLGMVFLPFVARSKALAPYLEDRRGLAVMAGDTGLFALMMLAIGLHAGTPRFFPIAAAISLPIILLAWGIFFLARNSKTIKESEPPALRYAERSAQPRRSLRGGEIALLAVGSPVWVPLAIAALAVLLSLYIVLWALIISLWAVLAACAAGAVGGAIMGVAGICQGSGLQGIVTLCAGLVLAGLAIFLFFGCGAATKGAILLTKEIAAWNNTLTRKENAK